MSIEYWFLLLKRKNLNYTEEIEVTADNENEALRKAYRMADVNCHWDEHYVEECDEKD